MSFTFEGSIEIAREWLPFAVTQKAALLASGIASTNITPSAGVLIMIWNGNIHIKVETGSISAGFKHTMVLIDGDVYVCGNNLSGQLGLGDNWSRALFNKLDQTATDISAGGNHSLLISGGTVQSAGLNRFGQLARDAYADQNTWGDTGFSATAIAAGLNRSIALAGASAFGAGFSSGGATGVPKIDIEELVVYGTNYAVVPEFRATNKSFDKVSAGYSHTLAILNGELWVTGDCYFGEFGTGVDRTMYYEFHNTGIPVDDISAGRHFSLILRDGVIFSCGMNNHGQLGLGDTVNRNVFTDTGVLADSIAAGHFHSLCISGGMVYGSGHNQQGELGLGYFSNSVLEFTKALDTNGVEVPADKIEGGGHHSFISYGEKYKSSGYNDLGQLGLGDTVMRSAFEEVNITL